MAAGCDKPGSTLQFLRKFIEISGRSMQKKENHKEHLKYIIVAEWKRGKRELFAVEKSISHAMPKEKSVGLNTH